jgi:hypothetical protein
MAESWVQHVCAKGDYVKGDGDQMAEPIPEIMDTSGVLMCCNEMHNLSHYHQPRNQLGYINKSSMAKAKILTEALRSFTSETNAYLIQNFSGLI